MPKRLSGVPPPAAPPFFFRPARRRVERASPGTFAGPPNGGPCPGRGLSAGTRLLALPVAGPLPLQHLAREVRPARRAGRGEPADEQLLRARATLALLLQLLADLAQLLGQL